MSNPTVQQVRTLVAATDLSPSVGHRHRTGSASGKTGGRGTGVLHVCNDGFCSSIKAI